MNKYTVKYDGPHKTEYATVEADTVEVSQVRLAQFFKNPVTGIKDKELVRFIANVSDVKLEPNG